MKFLIDAFLLLSPTARKSIAFGLGVILVLSISFCSDAIAGGNHAQNINLNLNYKSPPIRPTAQSTQVAPDDDYDGVGSSDFAKIMAMSMAADYCVFDYAPGWQGCVSTGWYDGHNGYNGMLATRIDNWMIKFGMQTDEDFDEYSGGVGASVHF